jgi:hypothetical protein
MAEAAGREAWRVKIQLCSFSSRRVRMKPATFSEATRAQNTDGSTAEARTRWGGAHRKKDSMLEMETAENLGEWKGGVIQKAPELELGSGVTTSEQRSLRTRDWNSIPGLTLT